MPSVVDLGSHHIHNERIQLHEERNQRKSKLKSKTNQIGLFLGKGGDLKDAGVASFPSRM
jgi:hypothetical protein